MKRLLSVTGLVMIVSAIYAQPTIIGIQAGTYSGARIDFSNNRNHFTWNRKQEMFANYEKLSMQGAALYEGKLYQFYDKGKGLASYWKQKNNFNIRGQQKPILAVLLSAIRKPMLN